MHRTQKVVGKFWFKIMFNSDFCFVIEITEEEEEDFIEGNKNSEEITEPDRAPLDQEYCKLI